MSWTLEEALNYYRRNGAPADQNALVQLLKEVQAENRGAIPSYTVGRISEFYKMKESFILALIRRIPSLRLEDKHLLELCAGPNCSKQKELAQYAEQLKKEGRNFELKFVPCMRMCGKGPNLRWDGNLYHGADLQLLDDLTRQCVSK